MELWQYILLAVVGVVGGILNVLAGGGSLIMMPTLILLGVNGSVANGTSRIAVIAQNLTAIYAFRKKGFSDFKFSLSLAACAIPGGMIGAFAGTKVDGMWLKRILAAIMIGVMILMATEKKKPKPALETPAASGPTPRRTAVAHVLMVGIGFYGGFIQAGVGFLLMPIMHRVLRLDLVRTNMHKVFIVAGYMIPALAVYAWAGKTLWVVGLVLAIGTSIGGYVGSHLAVKKGDPFIRVVLNLALAALAIKLLFT